MEYNINMKKEYKVSVITPFCNTDLKLFEECANHMINQTIGFDNVEWIIVLHNCKENYIQEVNTRLRKYVNVVTKVLNNDIHAASSPRNYALNLVSAPYLVFLDSDDFLGNDCLEKAYKAIKKTKAEIVGFRRAFIASKEGLFPMVDDVLYNSTEDLVVETKGKWDKDVVFYRDFLFVTSHIFDFNFIKKNGFKFDESIILGEDMYFMLSLVPKLTKIAFMPKFIGYTYYLHESSMIQKATKSDVQLLSFAKGFKNVYELDKKNKTNGLTSYACLRMLTNYILNSPDVKVETRVMIKLMLQEAIEATSENEKDEHYRKLIKSVIFNPEDPWKSEYVIKVINGQEALLKIINDNVNSDYGKRYNFKQVRNFKTYQELVPLQTYDDYKPIIDLYNKVGVDGILCSRKITRFFINSNNELIPNTFEHFNNYVDAFASLLRGKHNFLIGRSKKLKFRSNNGAIVRDLQSQLINDYFNHYLDRLTKEDATFSSEQGIYFTKTKESNYHNLLIDALQDKKIEQIVAVNTDEILNCLNYLKNNWKLLLKSINNKDRYKELKVIFEKGFNTPIAKKIWPKLVKIVGFGTGELYKSNNKLKTYTGNIPHNHGYYFTEEAMLGKAVEDDSDLFECSMADSFYELLPINKNTNKTTLISDAQVNETYQLIITNQNGLYRYITDHFITVKEKNNTNIKYIVY